MTELDSLLSFVPRFVQRRALIGASPEVGVERVEGVVLASDVSGFTQLALDLRDTSGGVEELRRILNGVFAQLISAIDEAGGDVVGFAGDSLVAFWAGGGDAPARAAHAALEAQRRLARSDHHVDLRIGLALGSVAMSTVGGERERWFLIAAGPAAVEAMAEQGRAELGQVAVTPAFAAAAGDGLEFRQAGDAVLLVGGTDGSASEAVEEGGIEAVDGDMLSALRPYLPERVVDRLVAGHDSFVSELRKVTVVFVLAPGIEDPSLLATLQDTTAALQRCAYRYDGLVEPGIDEKGISAVVVFGARAHEDDLDRALAAARAIDAELAQLGVSYGVGVSTGDAFCGLLGIDRRREYAILSDVVSVAARLAAAASEPGYPSVLCEGAIADAARSRWEFGPAVSLRLKGKEELHTCFEPGERLPRARLGRGAVVGRRNELEWVLDQVTGVDRSTGRLVVIEGDPGVGKSTLLGAVHDALDETTVTVRTGLADSLERSRPLHAWSAVFRDVLDVDGVAEGELAAHLERRTGPLAPLLGLVLGVDLPETPESVPLAGEQRMAATRTLLLELLARDRAATGALVVLLEDAHWFDSASWSLVHDAAALPGVVVVLTTRRADENMLRELGQEPAAARFVLEPLRADDVYELARARLGAAELDEQIEKLLLETCGGNPFFTVEVVQTLADRRAVVVESGSARLVAPDAIHVPPTIQAAITARVDDLSADEQLTLKVASVIGASFTEDVVAEIHPMSRSRVDLAGDLSVLAGRELVVPRGPGSYEFKHALTRDVAYGLMIGDQRRGLHRTLALHYEQAGDDLDNLSPVLAHHWLSAEDHDKAVSYLGRAAVSSLAHGMPREAVAHGVHAARILGIDLETDPAEIRAMLPGELAEIERLMAGRRPNDLLALPPLVDTRIGAGIGLILQAMPSAHQSLQSELFALMAIRNLNLTLRFGAGPLAAGVYAMYSIILQGLQAGNLVAYEFSELARTLDEANGGLLQAAVAFIHVWFNNHWFNPVTSGVPTALAGAEAGLAGPDLLYGSFDLAAATTLLATGGAHLDDVIARGEASLERIGPRSATASFHNRLEAQMAKALAGRTASLTSLSDGVVDEREVAEMADTANYNQAAYYYIAKLRLAYLAGDMRTAVRYAELAERLLPSFAAQVGQVELTVLSALARLADLPADDALRAAALDGVRGQLDQLETWTAGCRANFEHKATLVRGELAVAIGEPDEGDELLRTAADQAASDGFPQWAALACERRAHAAQSARRPADELFEQAAAHYRSWGAHGKAAEVTSLRTSETPAR